MYEKGRLIAALYTLPGSSLRQGIRLLRNKTQCVTVRHINSTRNVIYSYSRDRYLLNADTLHRLHRSAGSNCHQEHNQNKSISHIVSSLRVPKGPFPISPCNQTIIHLTTCVHIFFPLYAQRLIVVGINVGQQILSITTTKIVAEGKQSCPLVW